MRNKIATCGVHIERNMDSRLSAEERMRAVNLAVQRGTDYYILRCKTCGREETTDVITGEIRVTQESGKVVQIENRNGGDEMSSKRKETKKKVEGKGKETNEKTKEIKEPTGGETGSVTPAEGVVELSAKSQKVLDAMKNNGGPMKRKDMATAAGTTSVSMYGPIHQLLDAGLIERSGKGTYQLKEQA